MQRTLQDKKNHWDEGYAPTAFNDRTVQSEKPREQSSERKWGGKDFSCLLYFTREPYGDGEVKTKLKTLHKDKDQPKITSKFKIL